jgi:hemerythrin-like domain-containing protein
LKEAKGHIMPAGPLMKEHRVIESMIKVLEDRLHGMIEAKEPDLCFIGVEIDFLKTYADRCHHGKEEDILFKELEKKSISAEHKKIIDSLISDHVYGRKTVRALADAKGRYQKGDKAALKDIINRQKDLIAFYPRHIEVEDKHFFLPCMKYFSQDEQDCMLAQFQRFDAELIHDKYKAVVSDL